MKGHKPFTDQVSLRFRLSERVLNQNLYCQLAELLDWNSLPADPGGLYGTATRASFRLPLVEPVFGSSLQHYGLPRVNTRGSSAHKTMLRTSITFNLKSYSNTSRNMYCA
jgi:hypothetical protein